MGVDWFRPAGEREIADRLGAKLMDRQSPKPARQCQRLRRAAYDQPAAHSRRRVDDTYRAFQQAQAQCAPQARRETGRQSTLCDLRIFRGDNYPEAHRCSHPIAGPTYHGCGFMQPHLHETLVQHPSRQCTPILKRLHQDWRNDRTHAKVGNRGREIAIRLINQQGWLKIRVKPGHAVGTHVLTQ